MKRLDRNTFPYWLLFCIVLVLLVMTTAGVIRLRHEVDPARTEMVISAIRKAAVQCYALEGGYPPDIDYLKTHYGLQFDEVRYAYRYEVFASNLMPDIEVFER